MKRLVTSIIAVCCVFLLVGCDARSGKLADLIPMVMVEGELYLDTGMESSVQERCGLMDGEITSSVKSTETPTKK